MTSKARNLIPAYLLATSASIVAAASAHAVISASWTVETFSQFDQGDATSAYVTSLGELRPGWDHQRIALDGDAVWSSVRLSDGSILLGSDVKGSIVKVNGTSSKKLLSIPGAIAVVALTQTSDGSVYAATMPGNKLYRVDVSAGKATVVATLPSKDVETIWSLAPGPNGSVFAGVGPSGKLFSVTSNGTAKELFATGDKRVTAIAVDAAKNAVWFGTSERALVFRYDIKNNVTRAVADFAGNEISALAISPDRPGILVAANDLQDAPSGAGKTAVQVETIEKPNAAKGIAAKPAEAGTKPGADKDNVVDLGRRGAKKGKGALFAVTEDGRLTQLHTLTQTYFTAVTAGPAGVVYAGAADKGRVYSIEADGTVATAHDVDERAVSQLLWDGNSLLMATDDAAAMYRTTTRATKANYVSDVFDAKTASTFGRMTWQSQGSIVMETRSGNTAKPGPGWSEWQATSNLESTGPASMGMRSGKLQSPPGRYLQFRTSLRDEKATVRRVVTYYAPQNLATTVEDVTVEQLGKEPQATLKDVAGKARSPIVKLKWRVDNQDSDETNYSLEVRRDGDSGWRPLFTGKTPLTAVTWEWNTETFQDGWYRLRVTSSDIGANSLDRALSSTFTTPLFAVDNQRPVIETITVSAQQASATAIDSINIISEIAFSIDDGPWQLGTTQDGIFDNNKEQLKITLPTGLSKGTHTLSVRVSDAAGNIGSSSVSFNR